MATASSAATWSLRIARVRMRVGAPSNQVMRCWLGSAGRDAAPRSCARRASCGASGSSGASARSASKGSSATLGELGGGIELGTGNGVQGTGLKRIELKLCIGPARIPDRCEHRAIGCALFAAQLARDALKCAVFRAAPRRDATLVEIAGVGGQRSRQQQGAYRKSDFHASFSSINSCKSRQASALHIGRSSSTRGW